MLNGKRILVVLPAYNAEGTLEQTYREIPLDIVDGVLLVDDGSADRTVSLAKRLGLKLFCMTETMVMVATRKPVMKMR